MSTYYIEVTHWNAMSGTVRHQYTLKLTADSRESAYQQAWNSDPYAHRFEDVTEDRIARLKEKGRI